MTTIDDILTPELAEFARELISHGFKVRVFRSDVDRVAKGGRKASTTHLGFSRVVDGRECVASVGTNGRFGGYSFSMPMKPSRAHGSSMWIGSGDDMPEFDDLTVTNAELYASPTGYNRLVGTHDNDGAWSASLYAELVDD